MDFNSKHKVDPAFNMSSMTDVVFLLLVFFMLTSTFVTPSSVKLSLPESHKTMITTQKVAVSISKDKRYFVNDKEVQINDLVNQLKRELSVSEEEKAKDVIVIHADRDLDYEEVMKIAGIASTLGVKYLWQIKINKSIER